MKLIVLLSCLVVLATARRHRRQAQGLEELLGSIPECAAAKAAGSAVPNCPDLGTCLDGVHGEMKTCHEQLHQDAKFKGCAESKIDDKKATLKDGCRWTTAVKKCMEGGQEPGSEWDDIVNAAPGTPHAHTPHTPPTEEEKQKMKCMHDVFEKLKTCHQQAENCPNYKVCAGKEASTDATLAKWHKITNHLKHEKHQDMKKYWEDMKTCLAAA